MSTGPHRPEFALRGPHWPECCRCGWRVPRVVQGEGPTRNQCEACAALTDLAQLVEGERLTPREREDLAQMLRGILGILSRVMLGRQHPGLGGGFQGYEHGDT